MVKCLEIGNIFGIWKPILIFISNSLGQKIKQHKMKKKIGIFSIIKMADCEAIHLGNFIKDNPPICEECINSK